MKNIFISVTKYYRFLYLINGNNFFDEVKSNFYNLFKLEVYFLFYHFLKSF